MRINARAHSLWGTAICVAAIPAFATGTVKGMGVLEGTLVIVDPDDFADGTDMSNAVPGVTLSAIGSTPLTSAVFSDANSFGGQIFGHDGNFEPFWGLVTPSFDASLRADFTVPTDFVSVDFLMNNGFDPGILRAFNAADELIGEVELPGTAGAGNIETAEISSPIANIAYMIASTPDGTDVFLDRLTFNPGLAECLTVTDEAIDCHADGSTFTYTVEGTDPCTGGTSSYVFTASGGAPGEEMCFTLMVIGDNGGFCCTTEICVTIPDCTPVALPSDLDGDGIVGMVDFLALLDAWGSCSDCGTCPADFDGDCEIGILDLLILLGNWTA